MTMRGDFLREAITLTEGNRQLDYGSPTDNMEAFADMMTAYLVAKYRGKIIDPVTFSLTGRDAALFLVLLKMIRTFPDSSVKSDTFIDGAAYFAIAGEAAMHEQLDY